jgi:hypothetical protein
VRQIAAATLWLAVGHVLAGTLFWLLLNVPESNATTLAASASIAILFIVVSAIVEGTAVGRLQPRDHRRDILRRVPSALAGFLAAVCLFGAIWWATGRASRWLGVHGGEIDAWLLLHFNITRTGGLHATFAWILAVMRYVVGLSIAAALIVAGTADGARSIARLGDWGRRAFSPLRLLAVALCFAVFLWAPWLAVYWRPRRLPFEVETIFVIAKLTTLYLIANLGVALILRVHLARRT